MLKDLQDQGSVTWDEQARKVTFTAADNPSPGTPAVENVPLVIHTGQEIELKDIAIGSETITYSGQTIGTIANGRPMISLAFMAQALVYRSVTVQPRAICFENGSYGVELFPYQASAEMRVALRWIGGGIGYVEVNAAPADSADDVLIDELDLKQMFGYESEWNPETGKLQIRYIDYIVDDYGLSDEYRNYYYDLGAVGYLPPQVREMPKLFLRNSGNYSAATTSASLEGQSGTYEDGGRSGLSKISVSDWPRAFAAHLLRCLSESGRTNLVQGATGVSLVDTNGRTGHQLSGTVQLREIEPPPLRRTGTRIHRNERVGSPIQRKSKRSRRLIADRHRREANIRWRL
ncbi:hypothetical protein ACFFNY_23525 [Paenibacillus hodogayensis]|uniref:Copper amine oxidase-like N-terminal domain-containing protein n=1 Tax=Paenibacillus hodogayensis TaxID=279208 RepID=A0ABV5W2G0_9BACL